MPKKHYKKRSKFSCASPNSETLWQPVHWTRERYTGRSKPLASQAPLKMVRIIVNKTNHTVPIFQSHSSRIHVGPVQQAKQDGRITPDHNLWGPHQISGRSGYNRPTKGIFVNIVLVWEILSFCFSSFFGWSVIFFLLCSDDILILLLLSPL